MFARSSRHLARQPEVCAAADPSPEPAGRRVRPGPSARPCSTSGSRPG